MNFARDKFTNCHTHSVINDSSCILDKLSLIFPKQQYIMATSCSKIMEFMMLIGKLKVCFENYFLGLGDIKLSSYLKSRYVAPPICSLTRAQGSIYFPIADYAKNCYIAIYLYRVKHTENHSFTMLHGLK